MLYKVNDIDSLVLVFLNLSHPAIRQTIFDTLQVFS